ncbi:unknown [Ruminococcus sp. CAG:382]|nr:unknown [Ruminococcus sp. CAG:382]
MNVEGALVGQYDKGVPLKLLGKAGVYLCAHGKRHHRCVVITRVGKKVGKRQAYHMRRLCELRKEVFLTRPAAVAEFVLYAHEPVQTVGYLGGHAEKQLVGVFGICVRTGEHGRCRNGNCVCHGKVVESYEL